MEQGGKGRVDVAPGSSVEHLQLNQTDPNREVDGERSSVKAPHPFLTDPAVRTAMSLLVDRGSIQEQIYGRLGQATANFLNAPPRVRSSNTRWEFNVEKANQVLDAAGWKRGADGVRAKDGTRLKVLYQTSVNAPRQKTQAIVKQALTRAGFDVELKSVVASVYFSSDPGNPDTNRKFYADLQMYTTGPDAPDAQAFMERYVSWDIASKANKWQGQNVVRWRSEEFDRLWKSAETELNPVKRAGLFIRMNDLVIQNGVVVPILWRSNVSAVAGKLRGAETSAWDSDMWRLGHWYREA
jgi:peptide/nickel transport system substrate-binding protein